MTKNEAPKPQPSGLRTSRSTYADGQAPFWPPGLPFRGPVLVVAARATVPRLTMLPAEGWGAAAKRVYVVLPEGDRPPLVSKARSTHSFAEVVNQCATLERLSERSGRSSPSRI